MSIKETFLERINKEIEYYTEKVTRTALDYHEYLTYQGKLDAFYKAKQAFEETLTNYEDEEEQDDE